MPHRHRFLRSAMRLLSFEPRPAPACDDALEDRFFCACEFKNLQHSVNCPTNLSSLINLKDSAADLMRCWDLGYDNKDSEPGFSPAKGVAYCMGRDCRGSFPEKVPHFAPQPAHA